MSSLDNLRKTAKRWLKALRASDPEAQARLRRAYPQAPASPGLRDVQHALAREHGVESWTALKSRIEAEQDSLVALLDAAVKGDAACVIQHGADPIGEGDGHELGIIGWASCWDYREANKEIVDYLLAHGARHHLFSAVTMGEIETIRRLVAEAPSDLHTRMDRTNSRRTPLHLAVIKKQPKAVDTLIELGADTEALNAAGLTPLDEAALNGHTEIAQLLIDRGAAVRLPAAVALGRTSDIERLVREDPDCLKPGQRSGTLIVRASGRSPGHVIEMLLRLGADVNVSDDPATSVDETHGYTPLHAAAFHGNEGAVAVLVQHGADVNARDDRYCGTPAGWADYAGHRHIRDLLLRQPIDMFQAIQFGRTERIPQLLKTDRDALNRPFREYATCPPRPGQWWPDAWCTPLAGAVITNNVEASKYLLEEGAERTGAPDGRTLEDLASEKGRADVAALLRSHLTPKPVQTPRTHAERVATFLEFACWDNDVHGKGDHRMRDRAAQRLLAQHPEIARDSLYTAVVCGDLAEVERILTRRPEAARERGGARGWTPLLYLCYTRFSYQPAVDNAVAIARALLDRGADANDYYMAGHARYSVLVGVAREGEQDAPPHPRREELFQLLLERGADMYDRQVLYNTHFSGDVRWWLKLVYAHAVKIGRKSDWDNPNWPMFDMEHRGSGAAFLFTLAKRKNDKELAEWLTAHCAKADLPPPRGDDAIVEAFLRLDRASAHAYLADHPEHLQSPTLLFAAADHNRADLVEALLEMGTPADIRDAHNTSALHQAAGNHALAVAKLLIERGVEIDPRETNWDSTPIGWAAYGDKQEMVDYLSRYTRNVWTLAFRGYVDRLRDVLEENPALAKSVDKDGITPLWWLPDDEAKALDIVDLFLAHGADPSVRNKNGNTAADWALKRGMLAVADRLTQSPSDSTSARS